MITAQTFSFVMAATSATFLLLPQHLLVAVVTVTVIVTASLPLPTVVEATMIVRTVDKTVEEEEIIL